MVDERQGRNGRRLVTGAVAVAVLLGACGDDGEVDSVEAAQARVSASERAVTDAQAALDEATASFCADAEDYVVAVDRYGGVFDDSAATVGDVQTLGADLDQPREAAQQAADDVGEARDELARANEDLAEAQVALAEAQSSTSATAAPSTTTTTLVPPATVARVEQAEADLAAAAEAITPETPLTEASAQFNAAAFALEVAWLQLFADAGCLTEEQAQQAVVAVADYTTAVQTALQLAGYYDGPVDGVYGPATVEAVEQLQTDRGLPVTGLVDQATALALEEAVTQVGGDVATQAVAHTAAVQSTLSLAGYWTGPVDGQWTQELTDALIAFQTDLGVPPTGTVDAATLHALQVAIAEAQAATSTTTTESPETTETTAAASTTTTG